jgi:hypothetical protein
MSKWDVNNHIVGKAYDLTQENMNAMIADLERLKAENARLREENTDLEERIIKYWKECDLFEAENARLREAFENILRSNYGGYAEDIAREALKGGE